jgi:multiple sugar transport system ATP-binding protein
MSTVSVRDVTVAFEAVQVFDGLSLDIQEGEFIVLLGPSGCGKSTLLNAIAGLLDVAEGQIWINGKNVTWEEPKDRGIAMVFQSYALYPHMTVFENMAFGLRLRKMRRQQVRERVDGTARMLELFELLTRKPGQLSGGQRQRVAMGRAIVREPAAFLMDEPLSNLDAKLRVQMRAEISRLQREVDVTTIYVTHDQVEAMTMGDRVAVMKLGTLQQVDSPQILYRQPTNLFVAGFIGSPAMNMVEGTLVRSDGALAVEFAGNRLTIDPANAAERPALAGYDGRRVILGVRPEDMEDAALAPDSPADRRFKTTVELREDMGSEILVHFSLDAPPVLTEDTKELAADRGEDVEELEQLVTRAPWIARFDADSRAGEGDAVEILVDTKRLHFFDPDTGEAIRGAA